MATSTAAGRSWVDAPIWGDTLRDLGCDVIGAALGGALAYWAIGKRRSAEALR